MSEYTEADRRRIEQQRRWQEEERGKRDIEDIDGDINWAYSQMRIVEAWLEGRLEHATTLSDKDDKRIDKALVVTRTGLKMLKKVVKTRAPHLDTAAWRADAVSPN